MLAHPLKCARSSLSSGHDGQPKPHERAADSLKGGEYRYTAARAAAATQQAPPLKLAGQALSSSSYHTQLLAPLLAPPHPGRLPTRPPASTSSQRQR